MTIERTRKIRSYALMIAMTGFFGLAASGCPACNFKGVETGFAHPVVDLFNATPDRTLYMFGPGEFPVADSVPAKLLNPGATRVLDLGVRSEGDQLKFAVFGSDNSLVMSIQCEVTGIVSVKHALVKVSTPAIGGTQLDCVSDQLTFVPGSLVIGLGHR